MIDVIGALQGERDKLSRSEEQIADILLSDLAFGVKASITDLAARAEVSPPTVTRLCRRLGFQSFREFKIRLAQSTYVGSRYLDGSEMPERGPREVVETIINAAQSALYQLFEQLNFDQIDTAAEKLVQARAVQAFGGGGGSSMVVQELDNRLFRLGILSSFCTDHQMQMMRASAADARDVIVASSFSGRSEALAQVLAVARGYGAFTIAITRSNSLVAETADLVLALDHEEGRDILRPSSVRFAVLAMVDVLVQLVAMKRGEGSVEVMRRIKHQFVQHRYEDDRQVLGD